MENFNNKLLTYCTFSPSCVSYPIYIGYDALADNLLFDICKENVSRVVVVVEDKLKALYGEPVQQSFRERGITVELLTFVGGERNKTRRTKEELENALMKMGCGRDTCLVAVGGGVVSDMVGFVAATYCRGVPFVCLPTSLLAMADASVGGKTAVNTLYGKNMIGAFCQPRAVFIGLKTLKTLPLREYKNGLAEAIKYAMVRDERLLLFIAENADKIKRLDFTVLQEMLSRVCRIKKEIVEQDERDFGIRQICNFGHTVGHAIEQVSRYRIKHGRAVAMGIEAANYIACEKGVLSESDLLRMRNVWRKFAIEVDLPAGYDIQSVISAMNFDKKAVAGVVRFVLLNGVGCVRKENGSYTMPVTKELIEKSILRLMRI